MEVRHAALFGLGRRMEVSVDGRPAGASPPGEARPLSALCLDGIPWPPGWGRVRTQPVPIEIEAWTEDLVLLCDLEAGASHAYGRLASGC